MLFRMTLILLNLVFLTACATAPPVIDQQAVNHMVNIDRNGNFVPIVTGKGTNFSANERWRIQAMRAAFSTEDQDAFFVASGMKPLWITMKEAMCEHAERHGGRLQLMLYLHGGLNTERHSLKRAQKDYRRILSETDMYPVFINWRSGPVDSYTRHLTRIRRGRKSNTAPLTSPIYLLSDLLGSVAYAPKSWLDQGKHSWDSTVQRESDHWEAFVNSQYHIIHSGDDQTYRTTGRSALWLATSPVKIVSTPFTYTLSKPAWDIMVRRTGTMFVKPDAFHNNPVRFKEKHRGTGALTLFLERLENFQMTDDIQLEIVLFGHSMGAIVCNEIVRLFPKLNITTIVHMASADSIQNLLVKTVPFLETHPKTQFYALFLAPENEDRETSAWGLTPSGSLLTWIDNSFSTPATQLDRRAGRWSNLRRSLHLLPESVLDQMHFKIFGMGRGPQTHGAFDDFSYWSSSFYWQ